MKKRKGWFIPYILNVYNIERVVDGRVPGVYILGHMDREKFKVMHIKSGDNVKQELFKYLGKYPVFMYKPFKQLLDVYKSGQQAFSYR